jgi:molybdopterin-guanine dinucleotide biosynthesis protein A
MNPISIAIQAGGQSSRMGTDKSFVEYNGRPMIETVLAQVADLGEETFIVTNNPELYAYLGLPTVSDIYPDHGPLGGIHTAVFHASHPHTLVVACDMPWLKRPLLKYLISLRESADVIVPLWDKFPEPLHAIYSKACLPPIEENLKAKRLKITRFFGQVNVRYVAREEIAQFDENGRSFANINTPQDLTQAQKKDKN